MFFYKCKWCGKKFAAFSPKRGGSGFGAVVCSAKCLRELGRDGSQLDNMGCTTLLVFLGICGIGIVRFVLQLAGKL